MVYTPRLSDDKVAAAQNDIDQAFKRLTTSGFLKPIGKGTSKVQTLKQGRTGKQVVVETRKPRVTQAEVRQKLAAEATAKKQRLLAEAASKRVQTKAMETVRNETADIEQRIAAAEVLRFSVTFRGPEGQPRRVILRNANGTERISITLPRGKNRRRTQGFL